MLSAIVKRMKNFLLGLHHVTVLSRDAQRAHDFYSQTVGLRLLKQTVNVDAPGRYQLYFGNESGAAGTLLSVSAGPLMQGRRGAGQATEIGFSVPAGSLDFWQLRFALHHVEHGPRREMFGETYLPFTDPDGLPLALVVASQPDARAPWMTAAVPEEMGIRGLHRVTLTLDCHRSTGMLLTEVWGYRLAYFEENLYRYATDAVEHAAVVDLVEAPQAPAGMVAGSPVHHVAFRVKDEKALVHCREELVQRGLHVTEAVDQQYFHSISFREPGGVLFEVATENPGFMVDETLRELGTHLLLPPQYESQRMQLQAHLPPLACVHSPF
jgi:glyoxalase family protein